MGVGVAVNELEPNEQMIKRCEKLGSFAPLSAKYELRVSAEFMRISR